MKKIFHWLFTTILICSFSLLASCVAYDDSPAVGPGGAQKSIVILYENDVHCAIEGYTRMAGLRDAIADADTSWTAVVCSGDFLQGGNAGALSHGKYIIDIMRNMNYDAITLGNHEFDYGGERMKQLLAQVNAPMVCANFFDAGAEKPFYAPYTIKDMGSHRVAFVGVTTPSTMQSEAYAFYDSDANLLYDLKADKVPTLVQQAVDEAREKGADYVVVLSHLGEEGDMAISSHELIAATRGIDVVLDGHTHSVIEHDEVANIDGKKVPITQTGTKFANVGKLLITADGSISTHLIPINDIVYENARVSEVTDSIKEELGKVTARAVAHSDFELTINDADGKRLIRKGETNLGDLVADAFRYTMQSDIGISNAGGIRTSLPAGSITYGDVTNTLPYDDHMAKIEATGAVILTMLKACTAVLPEETGSFPQVSGMRFTAHQQSHTVTDVEVYDEASGTWKPIDPDRKYTIGLTDYYNGGGYFNTLKDCRQLELRPLIVRDAMTNYLVNTLGGNIPAAYAKSQGRITILDD